MRKNRFIQFVSPLNFKNFGNHFFIKRVMGAAILLMAPYNLLQYIKKNLLILVILYNWQHGTFKIKIVMTAWYYIQLN